MGSGENAVQNISGVGARGDAESMEMTLPGIALAVAVPTHLPAASLKQGVSSG